MFNTASMEVGRTNNSEDMFEVQQPQGYAMEYRLCVWGYRRWRGGAHQFSRRRNLLHYATMELGDQGVGSSTWISTASLRRISTTG